jgi:hypothetical protein
LRLQLHEPDQVYLVLLANGATDLDADLDEARVMEILTAEVARKKVPTAA